MGTLCIDITIFYLGVKTCNCSANDWAWDTDTGYFNDKSRFPVMALLMGDFGSSVEKLSVKLGPMECEGKVVTLSQDFHHSKCK